MSPSLTSRRVLPRRRLEYWTLSNQSSLRLRQLAILHVRETTSLSLYINTTYTFSSPSSLPTADNYSGFSFLPLQKISFAFSISISLPSLCSLIIAFFDFICSSFCVSCLAQHTTRPGAPMHGFENLPIVNTFLSFCLLQSCGLILRCHHYGFRRIIR